MARLKGFDYKLPYYYMVTIKRLDGLAAFSEIGPCGLVENVITGAFNAIIQVFHLKWRCLDEISPFVVMPDHIHLLIKLAPPEKQVPLKPVALGVVVTQLMKELSRAYWEIMDPGVLLEAATAATLAAEAAKGRTLGGTKNPAKRQIPIPSIFSPDWHDWIVKKQGQLAAFRLYIKENPKRAWERRANSQFFQRVNKVEFLGRQWFGYGNLEILKLPIITPFKGHRATVTGSNAWNMAIEAASRIGPGGAGVSTFMSPLEKACGNAIAVAGGKLIVLSPEGFSLRWHPARDKEAFCATGRMLFLSLYEATARQPAKQELYARCHEMIDLALGALPGIEA